MREKLLLKCENSIYADEVENLLRTNNIASRRHDESQDTRTGAYGPLTGIAIYVFEKDYDKARSLICPVLEERAEMRPFCPRCGSEEVRPIVHRHSYGTMMSMLCLFFILIPGLYLVLPVEFGFRSPVADYIALAMAVVGFILMFTLKRFLVNYTCGKCGKKFHRR